MDQYFQVTDLNTANSS